jgi:hypothetical protein
MTAGRLVHKKKLMLGALLAAMGALVLAALLTQQAAPRTAGAADHLDAPGIAPPPFGDGIGTDLTDIYAFQSPVDASKTVLIMNVNGLASAASIGHGPDPDRPFGTKVPQVNGNSNVYYYFRVDSNHDARADVNIQVAFGKPSADGSQQMRVKVKEPGEDDDVAFQGSTTGFGHAAVVNNGPMGIKAFAGRRDDPFFFDLLGFLNILGSGSFIGCTGSHPENDTFKGQNVSSIVLELPSSLLETGGNPNIGVWATTDVGTTQIDRMGRPAINTVFIPNNPLPPDRAVGDNPTKPSMKTTFNHGNPSTDVAKWTGEVVDTLTMGFGRSLADANALAAVLLPDILTVDVSNPAGFLNGRKPADDVIDAELNLLSAGAIPTDCVPANDVAFPATFPYLAAPHMKTP